MNMLLLWVLERAKMFASGFGAAFGLAVVAGLEAAGVPVDAATKASIIGFCTMIFTFWVPNKKVAVASKMGIMGGIPASNIKELLAPFVAALLAALGKFSGIFAWLLSLIGMGGTTTVIGG